MGIFGTKVRTTNISTVKTSLPAEVIPIVLCSIEYDDMAIPNGYRVSHIGQCMVMINLYSILGYIHPIVNGTD